MDGFSSYHNNGTIKEHDYNKLTQIGSSIQKISQNVCSIQRMVQQLGSSQDSKELRTQLDQIQQYTQQLAKDTSSNLKELNNMPPTALSPTEQRQFKMQKERLADEFATALNAFQATQRTAVAKVREQILRSKALVNPDPFAPAPRPNGDQQLIELQNSSGTNIRSQQQQLQDEVNIQLLEEQEQSMRTLEADIQDVNQIFKDLGSIIHEQGDMVDSIEANVELTQVFVSEGTQQLRQASSYKNKIRKKKLILIIIGTVVLTIIISIIAWQCS